MSESNDHKSLVEKIRSFVNNESLFSQYKPLVNQKETYIKNPHRVRTSSQADITFEDLSGEIYIIGEAKTCMYSLEHKSSKEQLDKYISFLSLHRNPHLIYAVPFIQFKMTQFEVNSSIKRLSDSFPGADRIVTHFIHDLYDA